MKKEEPDKNKPSAATFKVGAIALAFLVIGYQSALFMGRAARLRIEANRDRPDTVYVYYSDWPDDETGSGDLPPTRSHPRLRKREGPAGLGPDDASLLAGVRSKDSGRGPAEPDGWGEVLPTGSSGQSKKNALRRNAPHSPYVESYRQATRRVESFRFNPNTVSVEDLQRLGFSEKQARAIDNYRSKGGRFRRKADFARSFVVADSVYRRLERFIDIPRLDLNAADSTALDALPGIGPWFASKILAYRDALGGYSFPEQLLDIYHFDREKYDALSDLVFCSPPAPFALWTLPADSLRRHPYIRTAQAARAIVLFRQHTPAEDCTVAALADAGILPPDDAARLARCVIAPP